jgi:hypothetical protein
VHISNGGSSADTTSVLYFNNCLFQFSDDYAVKNDGQYSVYFSNCDFERTRDQSHAGSKIYISKAGGRNFNHTVIDKCHFEESGIDANAEGVNVTNSFIYRTNIILRERSQNCHIVNNSCDPISGTIVDLGTDNEISGLWANTLSNGLAPFRLQNNVLADAGSFKGIAGDEFLLFATQSPYSSSFSGSITYKTSLDAPLYSTEVFTLQPDAADPGTSNKAPKESFANLQCLRVDVDGGLKVQNATSVRAKKNLLTNGTFYNSLAAGWNQVGGTQTTAAATPGYCRIFSGGGQWGVYQDLPTVPGRHYMVAAQADSQMTGNLCLGDAWNGTPGAIQATAGSVQLGNGKWLYVLYLTALSNNQRVSLGNFGAGNADIKWIAAVDLDDDTLYAAAAPTTGTWAAGTFLKNLHPVESGIAGSKYVVSGWSCLASGTPGQWVQMRALTGN